MYPESGKQLMESYNWLSINRRGRRGSWSPSVVGWLDKTLPQTNQIAMFLAEVVTR
jgi:hypothetical protein